MKAPERHKQIIGCDTKKRGLWRATLQPCPQSNLSQPLGEGAAFCRTSLSCQLEPRATFDASTPCQELTGLEQSTASEAHALTSGPPAQLTLQAGHSPSTSGLTA